MAAPLKRLCRQATPSAVRNAQSSPSWISVWSPTPWQPLRQIHHGAASLSEQGLAASGDEIRLEAWNEELPRETDLSSTAHAELDQHRELRHMIRLAAWEMPLLARRAKPYIAPDKTATPLCWRYTTYFSESHPASRKVVVEFRVHDLQLGDREKEKLRKLAGARYNPSKGLVKMSCENFGTAAQNKRFLVDTINRLIAEAKDLETDSFEDVPLDLRHHKFKKVLRFPEEWKMTEEKRSEIEINRKQLVRAEAKRVEEGKIVSCVEAIEAYRALTLERATAAVELESSKPLPVGKPGKQAVRRPW